MLCMEVAEEDMEVQEETVLPMWVTTSLVWELLMYKSTQNQTIPLGIFFIHPQTFLAHPKLLKMTSLSFLKVISEYSFWNLLELSWRLIQNTIDNYINNK